MTCHKMLKPFDGHLHLRRGDILELVAGFSAKYFSRAIVMPNTVPPILTAHDAIEYYREISVSVDISVEFDFEPLMTIQINANTTPQIIQDAKELCVKAGKVYPQGVTTNSANGVADIQTIYPALEKMQELGMPALFHGEDPSQSCGATCLDREKLFLPTLYQIHCDFPKLKIVLEHITTQDAVNFISNLPNNVAATITPHHLLMTIDDVVGDLLRPHNFCKPIAKLPHDRIALFQAATSGNKKFFLGTDSAPHLKEKKECSHGCAGVFNAPVALPILLHMFETVGKLEMLENFASVFGPQFYGLQETEETIEFVKKSWTVPQEYNRIVPFMAGQTLRWQIAN